MLCILCSCVHRQKKMQRWIWTAVLRSGIDVSYSVCGRAAGRQRMNLSSPSLNTSPACTPPHPPQLTPSPSPSSSDTSSWQPAPFNSLQHLLGPSNHWCSAPTMATTPAPSLVGLSHLGPYDREFLGGGVLLLPQTAEVAVKREKKICDWSWILSVMRYVGM